MKKIPTLFRRDPENPRHLLPDVTSGCDWVFTDKEVVATRKYDGTCCMYDGERWWARREVKPGKQTPENFQLCETDQNTNKTVGWEPMTQSAFAKWHNEAIDKLIIHDDPAVPPEFLAGTYELIGPKINGNPEDVEIHLLIPHANAMKLPTPDLHNATPTFALHTLKKYIFQFPDEYEGIVWHHPDGRMCKLKRRDFV